MVTLTIKFKNAMVIASVLMHERSTVSFSLLNEVKNNFNSTMANTDTAPLDVSFDDIKVIYNIMGEQKEHYYAAVNADLKASLFTQLTAISSNTNNPQHTEAATILSYLNDKETALTASVENMVNQGKQFIWPS